MELKSLNAAFLLGGTHLCRVRYYRGGGRCACDLACKGGRYPMVRTGICGSNETRRRVRLKGLRQVGAATEI